MPLLSPYVSSTTLSLPILYPTFLVGTVILSNYIDGTDRQFSLYRDIIDTTPADGNVWKMLLGAVNDWFDDD